VTGLLTADGGRPGAGYRVLLRHSQFRLLLLGDSVGRLGFQLSTFLLPLLAVVVLRASGVEVGLIAFMQSIPVVLFALVAGALAGRVSLRTLLVACNAIRSAAFAFLLVAQSIRGLNLAEVLVAAILVGSATVFYEIGYQAWIPLIVTPTQLTPANGVLLASYSVSELAGPAMASLLLQSLGIGGVMACTFAMFAGGGVSLARLRHPRVDPAPSEERMLRSMVRGARFVWRCRPIRDLCAQAGLFNMFEQAFLTVFLIFAIRELRFSGTTVGLILGVGSAGALLGSLVAPRLTSVRVGVLVCAALPAAAIAYSLVPLSSSIWHGNVATVAFAFLPQGIAIGIFNVFAVSLRQQIPPADMLGATIAVYRLVSFGPAPLGGLGGGLLIDWLGGRSALWTVSVALALCSLALIRSPLRNLATVATAHEFTVRWMGQRGSG
jgi:MFS family permease